MSSLLRELNSHMPLRQQWAALALGQFSYTPLHSSLLLSSIIALTNSTRQVSPYFPLVVPISDICCICQRILLKRGVAQQKVSARSWLSITASLVRGPKQTLFSDRTLNSRTRQAHKQSARLMKLFCLASTITLLINEATLVHGFASHPCKPSSPVFPRWLMTISSRDLRSTARLLVALSRRSRNWTTFEKSPLVQW